MIKIFGIGNILLTDDSIGVHVAEKIKNKIENKFDKVKVFIGETDCYYCIDNIDEDDFIIIIDSACLGDDPGTVKAVKFREYYEKYHRKMMTAHDESLPEVIFREKLKNDGIILTVEGVDFGFGIGMSKEIEEKFEVICNEITNYIYNLMGES